MTPGFFDTIGTPLRFGRDVRDSDVVRRRTRLFAAVVSESFARQYFPGQDPIGRRFNFAFFDRTIVGVVGDIKVRGLEREQRAAGVSSPRRRARTAACRATRRRIW